MADITRWDPWGNMRSLRSAMDDLLERSFISPRMFGTEGSEGYGFAVDVAENENDVTVRAELPGIRPEDIDISVQGDVLTIRGQSRQEIEQREENFVRREIRSGSFSRSFTLPSDVNADDADAHFEDGILSLRLPKREEAKPRRIQVSAKGRESIPTSMRSQPAGDGGTYAQTGAATAGPTGSLAESGASPAGGGVSGSGEQPQSFSQGAPSAASGGAMTETRTEIPVSTSEAGETETEDPFGLREDEQ